EGLPGMRAAYLVDSYQWSGRFAEEPPVRGAESRAYVAFGSGYAAAMRGDRATASRSLEALDRATAEPSSDASRYARIMGLQVKGARGRAGGGQRRGGGLGTPGGVEG